MHFRYVKLDCVVFSSLKTSSSMAIVSCIALNVDNLNPQTDLLLFSTTVREYVFTFFENPKNATFYVF